MKINSKLVYVVAFGILAVTDQTASAADFIVSSQSAFQSALSKAKGGDRILLNSFSTGSTLSVSGGYASPLIIQSNGSSRATLTSSASPAISLAGSNVTIKNLI